MGVAEQVLAIPRSVFDHAGAFQGLSMETARYISEFFAPGVARFIPRTVAETDPSHKQIIPYVLLTHGGRVLSYVRGKRAGESRLVGSRSIGIGGHINPSDDMPLFSVDLRDAYRTAVEREVLEEISVDTAHSDEVVALINDDSTDVGRVHIGVVHIWSLDADRVTKREQMITQLEFATVESLMSDRDSLEPWSRICLDNLNSLIHTARPLSKESLPARKARSYAM